MATPTPSPYPNDPQMPVYSTLFTAPSPQARRPAPAGLAPGAVFDWFDATPLGADGFQGDNRAVYASRPADTRFAWQPQDHGQIPLQTTADKMAGGAGPVQPKPQALNVPSNTAYFPGMTADTARQQSNAAFVGPRPTAGTGTPQDLPPAAQPAPAAPTTANRKQGLVAGTIYGGLVDTRYTNGLENTAPLTNLDIDVASGVGTYNRQLGYDSAKNALTDLNAGIAKLQPYANVKQSDPNYQRLLKYQNAADSLNRDLKTYTDNWHFDPAEFNNAISKAASARQLG
jgi:hypothetical protein